MIKVSILLINRDNQIERSGVGHVAKEFDQNIGVVFRDVDRIAKFQYPIVILSPFTEPKGYKYDYRDYRAEGP